MALGRQLAVQRGVDEVVVIGGAEIFRATLASADRIYLTLVRGQPAGDTHLDAFDPAVWTETAREPMPQGAGDQYPADFIVLERQAGSLRIDHLAPIWTLRPKRESCSVPWLREQDRRSMIEAKRFDQKRSCSSVNLRRVHMVLCAGIPIYPLPYVHLRTLGGCPISNKTHADPLENVLMERDGPGGDAGTPR